MLEEAEKEKHEKSGGGRHTHCHASHEAHHLGNSGVATEHFPPVCCRCSNVQEILRRQPSSDCSQWEEVKC